MIVNGSYARVVAILVSDHQFASATTAKSKKAKPATQPWSSSDKQANKEGVHTCKPTMNLRYLHVRVHLCIYHAYMHADIHQVRLVEPSKEESEPVSRPWAVSEPRWAVRAVKRSIQATFISSDITTRNYSIRLSFKLSQALIFF
jgi:hypothetical protein